jgi:hypothetical protein
MPDAQHPAAAGGSRQYDETGTGPQPQFGQPQRPARFVMPRDEDDARTRRHVGQGGGLGHGSILARPEPY